MESIQIVHLKKALTELGCTPQEQELYVAALQNGPSKAEELSGHIHVSRPNVYKLINSLREKQLLYFEETKKYHRLVSVASPTVVLARLQSRQKEVSDMLEGYSEQLPDMLSLFYQGSTPTNVRVFQGEEHFTKALRDIFEEVDGEVKFFGSIKDFQSAMSKEAYEDLVERRLEKNIRLKALVLPSEEARAFQRRPTGEMRTVRFLTGAKPFRTSFQLSKTKVLLWQPEQPLVLQIEDKLLVEMVESMFEMLWQIMG